MTFPLFLLFLQEIISERSLSTAETLASRWLSKQENSEIAARRQRDCITGAEIDMFGMISHVISFINLKI
jgi:hypothetical protein